MAGQALPSPLQSCLSQVDRRGDLALDRGGGRGRAAFRRAGAFDRARSFGRTLARRRLRAPACLFRARLRRRSRPRRARPSRASFARARRLLGCAARRSTDAFWLFRCAPRFRGGAFGCARFGSPGPPALRGRRAVARGRPSARVTFPSACAYLRALGALGALGFVRALSFSRRACAGRATAAPARAGRLIVAPALAGRLIVAPALAGRLIVILLTRVRALQVRALARLDLIERDAEIPRRRRSAVPPRRNSVRMAYRAFSLLRPVVDAGRIGFVASHAVLPSSAPSRSPRLPP